MFACKSLFRVDRLLKLTNTYVKSKPDNYFQGLYSNKKLSLDLRIGGVKDKLSTMDRRKRTIGTPVWKPVCTQASSLEEPVVKDVGVESEIGSQMQEVNESMIEVKDATVSPKALEDDIEDEASKENPVLSAAKHSLSVEVGASVIQFVRGKDGSTKEKIEKETGVQIILPSSKQEDAIIIEGTSAVSVAKASKEIQHIINEAVKNPSLDYSHFVSLPLAIHPELVAKLFNFQNSILGISDANAGENLEGNSNGDGSEGDAQDEHLDKGSAVAVELKVANDMESVKVDVRGIPLSISPKVMDALDNRPLFVRLKGLDCMRGSLDKARVVYAPVEEIGSENRLSRACQVIIDAFVEAGLVLERDIRHEFKLHATVMNAKHRKRRKNRKVKSDFFNACGIFKQFGSEEWGEYHIREAHLSQRFKYDENGYYHCCASIPFPENMQVD
ncbi:Activating signal cointegrator 1 complex subunit 1 [Gossypium arboreum]|uniref:Activating signal cointegrator 1 complex subunit 1 n=1 Tax=Gossypium arboreum TaxID=29729 RepID=A0A0B0MID9_GOSAR|nr:Activating signal cointegrator 1 complex subunit 1 [Gossypium arboreum]